MVASFTKEDLTSLVEAPMVVGMAIAAADLGVFSTVKEAAAMAKEIATAAQRYPSNSVIQAAFSEENLKSGVKPDTAEIKPEDVQTGAVLDKAIASVNTALALLEGKATPEEISEFKSFIYSSAEAVANAAGSGLFGSGNPKVSTEEASALAKLKAALGI